MNRTIRSTPTVLTVLLLMTCDGWAAEKTTTAKPAHGGRSRPEGRASFLDYIKAAANSDQHGLRKDGRFYPYLSPQGPRIGYRMPIPDKKLYLEGWSAADAEQALREQLQAVETRLRVRLRRELKREFDALAPASREILLDFGFTEGVATLKPDFVETVVRLDWKQILNPDFYARYEVDWPDSVRNKAFYERWSEQERRP